MGQQSNKRKAGAALGARPSSRGGNKKQQQQRSKPPATAANKKRRGDLYEAEETVADEEVHARKYDVSCWCCVRAWRRRDAHTLAQQAHLSDPLHNSASRTMDTSCRRTLRTRRSTRTWRSRRRTRSATAAGLTAMAARAGRAACA